MAAHLDRALRVNYTAALPPPGARLVKVPTSVLSCVGARSPPSHDEEHADERQRPSPACSTERSQGLDAEARKRQEEITKALETESELQMRAGAPGHAGAGKTARTQAMAETKAYTGGCHCGAVRYRVKVKLEAAMTCNCSICSKTGTLLTFVPASEFELLNGRDALTDYQFGKKRIHHLFCNRCGIRSFARGVGPDGVATVAVNVRCLDGVDPDLIPLQPFDGRSLPAE